MSTNGNREPGKPGAAIWRWLTEPIASALTIISMRDRRARLEESEHRYRTLFESAGDAIFIHSPEGPILEVNEVACERLGYSRDEFLQMTVMDVDSSKQAPLVPEQVAELQRQGRLVFETEHVRRDSTLVPTEISSRMIEYGGQPAVLSIARDITERKRTQEALQRRAEELFALSTLGHRVSASLSLDQVVETALEHIMASVAPDVTMLYLRQGEELPLKDMRPDIAEIRRAEAGLHRVGQCLCGLATDTGQPIYSSNIHTDPRCTREECKRAGIHAFAAIPLRRGDDVLAVLGLASTTERDFGEQAAFLEALASEIAIGLQNALLYQQVQGHTAELEREATRRERVEDVLRTERDLAESLIETAQTIVLVLDPEGRIVRFNPYMEEISGYLLEEVQGKDWFTTFLPGQDHAEIRGIFQQAMADTQTRGNVNSIITKDGQERLIEWYDKTLKDVDGNAAGLLAVGQNVTERKQADEALDRRARELATLNAVGRRVGASLSLVEVAQAALDEIVPSVSPDLAMLFLEKDGGLLLQATSPLNSTPHPEEIPVQVVGERLCGLAADEGEPIYCGDIRNDARCASEENESAGVTSFAALPLRSGETVIGVLGLASVTERDFGADAAFLETLADQVAIGIHNALLHQEVERRWRELSTLYGASLILSQSLDPEVIAQTLIELMEQHLAYEHGAVAVLDEETLGPTPLAVSAQGRGQDFVAQAKEHVRSLRLRRGQGIVAWVMEHGEPVRLGNAPEDPRYYTLVEEVRSELCVPLTVGERVIGALNVESARPDAYDEQDEWLLTALAGPAAVAIENARLYEQVRDYATTLEQHVAERTAELEARVAEVERLNWAMTNLLQDLQASNRKLEEVSQELRRTNAELETFAYSVSHDLKAPLRGIDGYSRLLLTDHAHRLDDDGRTFVHTIRRAAEEMNQLIDDLLAYSRLERRTVHTTQVALLPLVEAAIAEFGDEIQARGVELRVDLPCQTVTGEAEGLSQALRNLLSNALKFSRGAAQPQVDIGGRVAGDVCTISVRDNGIGFDMQYHDRIFEIFQRLHRAEDYPGTGVGLAIVRKAVQRMGGRVWAKSAPGEGATFFLEIPR